MPTQTMFCQYLCYVHFIMKIFVNFFAEEVGKSEGDVREYFKTILQ